MHTKSSDNCLLDHCCGGGVRHTSTGRAFEDLEKGAGRNCVGHFGTSWVELEQITDVRVHIGGNLVQVVSGNGRVGGVKTLRTCGQSSTDSKGDAGARRDVHDIAFMDQRCGDKAVGKGRKAISDTTRTAIGCSHHHTPIQTPITAITITTNTCAHPSYLQQAQEVHCSHTSTSSLPRQQHRNPRAHISTCNVQANSTPTIPHIFHTSSNCTAPLLVCGHSQGLMNWGLLVSRVCNATLYLVAML